MASQQGKEHRGHEPRMPPDRGPMKAPDRDRGPSPAQRVPGGSKRHHHCVGSGRCLGQISLIEAAS